MSRSGEWLHRQPELIGKLPPLLSLLPPPPLLLPLQRRTAGFGALTSHACGLALFSGRAALQRLCLCAAVASIAVHAMLVPADRQEPVSTWLRGDRQQNPVVLICAGARVVTVLMTPPLLSCPSQ
jgi:hypothetical protein